MPDGATADGKADTPSLAEPERKKTVFRPNAGALGAQPDAAETKVAPAAHGAHVPLPYK